MEAQKSLATFLLHFLCEIIVWEYVRYNFYKNVRFSRVVCYHAFFTGRDILHLPENIHFALLFLVRCAANPNKTVIILWAYVHGKRCNYIYFIEANQKEELLLNDLSEKE